MIPGINDYTISYDPPDGNESAIQIFNGNGEVYTLNYTGLTPGQNYFFTLEWELAFTYPTDSVRTCK